MKPKGNSIERRIEIAMASIERNKDRKQRREKAEAKLEKLLQLKEELEREQAEKEERRSAEKIKERKHLYYIQVVKPKKEKPFIYGSDSRFEREPREEDMYTKYELEHIEELYPEEKGRINWLKWNEVVEECRRMFK